MRGHLRTRNAATWDVVIIGAGPAGLSAALILGRACRRVLICDSGTPRSWASKAMHGFLTREGISPDRFRRIARHELRTLRNVSYVSAGATAARKLAPDRFEVTIRGHARVQSRKVLIATGLVDHLPPIKGIEQFFGTGVFQCPYCDGWETRRGRTAVYGRRQRGFEMARALTAWNDQIVLCTDGQSGLSPTSKAKLRRNGVQIIEDRVSHLEGIRGTLRSIAFRTGRREAVRALYFDMPCSGQSRLAESLGCEFNRRGGIRCGQYEATSVPGVFVAGNLIRDVQLSIVAAAEGARAAFGINRALTREDFERAATGRRQIEHPPLEEPKAQKRARRT